MKTNEIIEKKLKKYSAAQLLAKLEKGNLPESEKEIAIEILEKRGQDVSKFKPVSVVEPEVVQNEVEEKVEAILIPTRQQLIEEVDEFVDTLIEDHRDGVYEQVMKALGGKFDSDLDELLDQATESQLKDVLTFKNIKQSNVKNAVVKEAKKSASPKKVVEKVKSEKSLIKSYKQSVENEKLHSGMLVSFEDKDKNIVKGYVVKMFLSHKNNKEICEVRYNITEKPVHKRTNKLTINE